MIGGGKHGIQNFIFRLASPPSRVIVVVEHHGGRMHELRMTGAEYLVRHFVLVRCKHSKSKSETAQDLG